MSRSASRCVVFVGPAGAGVDITEQTGVWHGDDTAANAGRFAGRAIERAVALALEGAVDGIVTLARRIRFRVRGGNE